MHFGARHFLLWGDVDRLAHATIELESIAEEILRGNMSRSTELAIQLGEISARLEHQDRLVSSWRPTGSRSRKSVALRRYLSDSCAEAASQETDCDLARTARTLAHLLRTYVALERHELTRDQLS